MGHHPAFNALSEALGWSYFFAWSLSFYPQVILNYRRKSVRGMSVDFQLLNLLGFVCYSIFTCTLRWNAKVRKQYDSVFEDAPNLVTTADCGFALHGAALTAVALAQAAFYHDRNRGLSGGAERVRSSSTGSRTPEPPVVARLTVGCVGAAVFLLVGFAATVAVGPSWRGGAGPTVLQGEAAEHGGGQGGGVPLFSWLCWVYLLSLVKLGVTLTKYVPQAWLNYRRQSTVGWSIHNVLLDFAGGALSVAQLLLDGATLGWGGLVGDPIKFALGFVSMAFDVVFLAQHYCLYPNAAPRGEAAEEDQDTRRGFMENLLGEPVVLKLPSDNDEGLEPQPPSDERPF